MDGAHTVSKYPYARTVKKMDLRLKEVINKI